LRRLEEADPAAYLRMRRVVGSGRGRIRLDDEAVDVSFGAAGELVLGPPVGEVDGEGATDRQTVFDLLDGYVEVGDAILDGRLRILGPVEQIARMFEAIEILLDGSARIPSLQQLARDFRDDPGRPQRGAPVERSRSEPWHPGGPDDEERSLLERLDLVP
jgi:hypothetical protein